MIAFELILASNYSLYYKEVFQMASTLAQQWLTIFCYKAKNLVYFGPYNFVQISQACGPNTYQITYEETFHFLCQH